MAGMTLKALIAVAHLAAILPVADRDPASQAWAAVETALRQHSPEPNAVRVRNVEVFAQSAPDTIAICGQVNPGGATGAFIDFAAVVTMPQAEGEARVRELHLADAPKTAARTRAEIWLRCGNETKRIGTARIGTAAGPEVPPAPRASSPAAARLPAGQRPPHPGSSVTVRQGANVRAAPDGRSPVVQVVRRGTVAQVFGEPVNGWYQIGDTAPWGWMHGSMLAGPPR